MKRTYKVNKRMMVCEKIRMYIRENKMKQGDRLPSQRQMCELFGVSRQCIFDALNYLAREGTIYTQPCVGIFVNAPPFEVPLVGSSSLRRYQYLNFSVLATRVVVQRGIHPSWELQQIMQLEEICPVMELIRTRQREGNPLCLEYSYTPLDLFPDFTDIDFSKNSIRENFVQRGHEPILQKTIICMSTLSETDAMILGAQGQVMVSSGVVRSGKCDRVIEYYASYSTPASIVLVNETGS